MLCSDVVYCLDMSCVVQFCLYYGALLFILRCTFVCVVVHFYLCFVCVVAAISVPVCRTEQDRAGQDRTGQIE